MANEALATWPMTLVAAWLARRLGGGALASAGGGAVGIILMFSLSVSCGCGCGCDVPRVSGGGGLR